MDDRRTFLVERARGIGGSDIPAVLGISPWSTPLQLFHEKRKWMEDPDGMVEENLADEKEWHYWGHKMEPLIAERYEEETGRRCMPCQSLVNPDHSEIRCNIDYLVYEDEVVGVMDTKNRGGFSKESWDEGPPDYLRAQVLYNAGVLNSYGARGEHPATFGSCAVLMGGNRFLWGDLKEEDGSLTDPTQGVGLQFVEAAFEAARNFWSRVKHNDPPPAGPGDLKTLKLLYPDDDHNTIDLPDEAYGLDQRMSEVSMLLLRYRKEKEEVEAKLREMMGSATFGRIPQGGTYSLKTQKRKAFTVEATTYRTLRRMK